jgi:hypothetical protein
MTASDFPYGFRIVGKTCEARRLVDAGAAFAAYAACDSRAQVEREAYLSAFRFGADFRELLESTGSTAGYTGLCFASWLWFDVDAEGDLPRAQADAESLAEVAMTRYQAAADELLIFFSGSKGFHLGLPTALWSPAPSADFHRIARHFAANLATVAAVTIDAGVYDKVRAFRAPNSKHPKTGLCKRRLAFAELTGPLAAILELAKTPAPFTVPTVAKTSDQAAADWQGAAALVAQESEAKAARRAAGNGAPTLNRSTLAFIREGAHQGDRHRLLFSAAVNLGEFGCSPALAVALLEESALDSGLAPKDVRRQIECGLSAAGSPSQQATVESPQIGLDGSTVQEPPQAAVGDSRGLGGQTCQQLTPAPLPAAGDVQAELAKLWGSAPAPNADRSDAPPAPARKCELAPPPPKPAAPTPPAGATFVYQDGKGRACSPSDCHCWTWEGGRQWYRVADYPPPGAEKGRTP